MKWLTYIKCKFSWKGVRNKETKTIWCWRLEDQAEYPEVTEDSWTDWNWGDVYREEGKRSNQYAGWFGKSRKLERERQISDMVEMNQETWLAD